MRLRREHRVRPAMAGRLRTAMSLGALLATLAFVPSLTHSADAGVRANVEAPILGWQALANAPPFNPGAMFLLTDGAVMVQDLSPTSGGSPNWWRLTPDSSGSYVDGTWSQLASLPSYYSPFAYAAAVLPDGRLAIEGGEYNDGIEPWTNLGAIYDPVTNAWTMVAPPNGGVGDWSKIGDAPSEVLADGRWLVGDSGSWTTADAIFDPGTLTWATTGGPGKVIGNAEAGFTLLPGGNVLTVDVLPPACTTRGTEILDRGTLKWSSAGPTPAPLVDCGDINELGPQIMTYSGKVFVAGTTGATALYAVSSGTWSSGPNFPAINGDQQDGEDSGEALLPDGNVLVATRTGEVDGATPTHFFLFDGTSLTQAPEYATSSEGGSLYMLLLPTGQVLYNGWPAGLHIFTDPGSPNPAWAPTITAFPAKLAAGDTYTLAGLQLNGLSDGAAFGDDYQDSSDYPLVQITNDGTGDIAYARTSGMTNRSIAPGESSCTAFTLPAGIETGSSNLRVIANGIASTPVPVTVGAGGSGPHTCPSYTVSLAKAGTGSGTVTSSQSGIACGATCSNTYENGTIVTMTAAPSTGSAFAGWSGGGCSGTGPCIVTVNSDTSVTATFNLIPETLAVAKNGDGVGAVTSSPGGINCGSSCSHAYDYGSSVTLTRSAAAGSAFAGWTGDCTGVASCVVTMAAAHSVTAAFVKDCVVPKVKGKGLQAAKRSIRAHDCSVGRIGHAFSRKVRKGRVISQQPKPRKLLKHGAKVRLTVSKGRKP
jgi:hypothetical protein